MSAHVKEKRDMTSFLWIVAPTFLVSCSVSCILLFLVQRLNLRTSTMREVRRFVGECVVWVAAGALAVGLIVTIVGQVRFGS